MSVSPGRCSAECYLPGTIQEQQGTASNLLSSHGIVKDIGHWLSMEPPAKRPRLLACARCRRRKRQQKCHDERPCRNCLSSSAECVASTSIYYQDHTTAQPLRDQRSSSDQDRRDDHYVDLLEQRLARLERMLESPHPFGEQWERQHRDPYPAARPPSQPSSLTTADAPALVDGMLARSTPAIGLLATFAHSPQDGNRGSIHDDSSDPINLLRLDDPLVEQLLDEYKIKIHTRYPFVLLPEIVARRHEADRCRSFFIYVMISIGLLLRRHPGQSPSENPQIYYRRAVTQCLSHVFALDDKLLHIQAYLVLGMHALHSPSTERICALASATMRMCVMHQLHLREPDGERALHAEGQIRVQIRRRVFWSAYQLDRAVGTMFDLPFSVADYVITCPIYANLDDDRLLQIDQAQHSSASRTDYTSISAALHVVYMRQIQSEILNITLHREFASKFDQVNNWRLRILEKLERWKSLCHRVSDIESKTYTNPSWLHMIYNFSLTMLYRPTRQNAKGPSPEWTLKSCCQACLIFRHFQRQYAISEAWMGLLQQFKCGVALLYCYFVTPPEWRTETFSSSEVPRAIRACSVILSLLAEKWPESACLRDTFEILAEEVPLADEADKPPGKIAPAAARQLQILLPELKAIVIHRDTLRMVQELATDSFQRLQHQNRTASTVLSERGMDLMLAPEVQPDVESDRASGITADIFQPFTPLYADFETARNDGEIDFEGYSALFDFNITF